MREFLRQRLPEYMIPGWYVLLEQMPLTANGKVNRRALPAPERSSTELDKEYVEPRTEAEEVLAAIMCEVLRIERVSINDNFFEMGGHSLLATQVISRIRKSFLVDMSLRTIFDAPTIAGLAELVGSDTQAK